MPTVNALKGQRIGLLGGSFNPAHEGHLHISKLALDRLGLDAVWWMVSPQNPLKSTDDMAGFSERMGQAAQVAADDHRIIVTGIERELGTRFTVDTVQALKRRFPRVRFVLVMGADLLAEVPKWKNWCGLFNAVPIAVFARPSYSYQALSGKAARRLGTKRVSRSRWSTLVNMRPPAWAFLRTKEHSQSATRIRAGR